MKRAYSRWQPPANGGMPPIRCGANPEAFLWALRQRWALIGDTVDQIKSRVAADVGALPRVPTRSVPQPEPVHQDDDRRMPLVAEW
jgi:hypothetical protein